jgi:predicted nucleic acid-binding protein
LNQAPRYFIDSNIIVYAFDARDVEKRRRAMDVMSRLAELGSAAVSVQVLGETYVSLAHCSRVAMTAAEAEQVVRRVAGLFRVFDLSIEAVDLGLSYAGRFQLHYWDALILATARYNGPSVLLTENLQTGRVIEGISIVNPLNPSFDLDSLG